MNKANFTASKDKVSKPATQDFRLYRMGLVDIYRCPEELGIAMLASITSGCLYDDLGQTDAISLYKGLTSHKSASAYAILERAYAQAGEPVPKSIYLLSKNEACLCAFLTDFSENWQEYLRGDKLLEGEK